MLKNGGRGRLLRVRVLENGGRGRLKKPSAEKKAHENLNLRDEH